MLSGRLAAVALIAVGGILLKKKLASKAGVGDSSFIEDSIEVEVPVRTAYDQWTQFEDFPEFMKDVECTRVMLRMYYRPRNSMESMADFLSAVNLEVAGNLHRFAEFIQSRRHETGAWRGTVEGGTRVGAVSPLGATPSPVGATGL